MRKMKNSMGITLIALVITIIVLLILAGVSIATLTGENGLLTKARKAKDESALVSYLEEIKLEIIDEQAERKYQTKEEAFIESILNRLHKSWVRETYMCDENFEEQQEIEKNTVLIINTVDNYQIIIDVDNTKISAMIRESFKMSGKMATIEYNANGGTSETIEKQEIKVGSIFSFADNPYTREGFAFIGWCEDSSGNGKVYQPKEKIIVKKEKMTLYAIWFDGTSTSLLKGIEMLDSEGYHQIKVNEITYNLHMYYYEGNQTWNENKTFGDENDVGTSSMNAKNMVVVKVNGDLTVDTGAVVGPYHTDYGGPKGFLVYCTGTLTNNGTIQNNYGAKASGENVYLWRNTDESYEFIPAVGAAGGAAIDFYGWGEFGKNGNNGSNASSLSTVSGSGMVRGTAGGGSGGLAIAYACDSGGRTSRTGTTGAIGSSYSGGAGAGGVSSSQRDFNWNNLTGISGNLSIGGNSVLGDSRGKSAAGGGAGCNPGIGNKSQNAISVENGNVGTGGLLIIYSKKLNVNTDSTFSAYGSKGGGAVAAWGANGPLYSTSAGGGAGSGGGSINIFTEDIEVPEGTINSHINVFGGAGGVGSGGTYNASGGTGGIGSCNIGYITTGTYQSYYSNN